LIEWALRTHPLEYAPGTHFGYSNFGYCLLGRVIEKVTGQPYAAYAKQNILAKCGITTMQIAGNTLEARAPGEVLYYGNGSYTMNVTRMDSHGGWISTPAGLVQFLMHVDGFDTTPNILLPDTIKAMTAPGAVNPGYGCGWCLNKWNNRWHNGSLPGATTIMVRTARGLCWAALANIRTKDIDGALDSTMWKIAKAVPAWQA
jgi:CubicO group peptidase (beta-lactamase class C family)